MKFSIMGFFSKCDQIRSFLRIWSHLLLKSLTRNFIFCAVMVLNTSLSYTDSSWYYKTDATRAILGLGIQAKK